MVYAVTDSRTSPSRAARTRRSCPSCTFSGPRRARPRAGRPARQDPHHNHTGQNTAPYRRTARAGRWRWPARPARPGPAPPDSSAGR